MGGLTFVLGFCSLSIRRGPPWRVWLSGIFVVSALASLGSYTSPIWVSRAITRATGSRTLSEMLSKLGPLDAEDSTPIRQDGFLRDGDGSLYWLLTQVLPGFRQFRFPGKLFTFSSLALAALAGWGWDHLTRGPRRGFAAFVALVLCASVGILVTIVINETAILAAFRRLEVGSVFGPFEVDRAYRGILSSLGQTSIVSALALLLIRISRRGPHLAGALAVIVMTGDLGSTNARYILTVPQSMMETKPEVLSIIEAAERAHPSRGPFRIHRMPAWDPLGWHSTASKDRVNDFVSWERDTLQPKYGINWGVEFTHTIGVAELYDYEWYFSGFPRTVRDPELAKALGIETGKEVVYYPRRGFDMWNTRYFIVPAYPNGWRDDQRGYASFVFAVRFDLSRPPERFRGPNASVAFRDWV